ncbi:MAG: HAD family hydrolase [Candidatus Hodarchaeota archaeon]
MARVSFDMDGVLVEVTESYRQAVITTFEVVLSEEFGVVNKSLSFQDVQLLKDTGIFNNDWILTQTAVAYALSGLEFSKFLEIAVEQKADVNKILMEIRPFLGDSFPKLRELIDSGFIVKRFEEIYLGADLYERFYGDKPSKNTPVKGMIENEKLMAKPKLFEQLINMGIRGFGITSGRPRDQALYSLEKFSILKYFEKTALFFMHDAPKGKEKPHPYTLDLTFKKLEKAGYTEPSIYVGDTISDLIMAKNYGKCISVCILSASFNREEALKQFKAIGADIVIEDVTRLPEALLEVLKLG